MLTDTESVNGLSSGNTNAVFELETAARYKRAMKCLSRMKGNFHVRFLEGLRPATVSGYSVMGYIYERYRFKGISTCAKVKPIEKAAFTLS